MIRGYSIPKGIEGTTGVPEDEEVMLLMVAVEGEEDEVEEEDEVGVERKNEGLLLSLLMISLDIMDDWSTAAVCRV